MHSFLYNVKSALGIALRALQANKSRAILTTLGIVIGILAIATTMTVSNGLANNFRESIQAVGSDILYVSRMPWIITGDYFKYRNRPHIKLEEAEELALRMEDSKAINPSTFASRKIKYRSKILENILIVGTTEKEMLVSQSVPELGRFFNATDVYARRYVCVIGAEIRENLFGEAEPLNKEIKLGRQTFRVIGVMEKQGGSGFFGGPNFDRYISVPITTFAKAYGVSNREISIAAKAPSQAGLEDFRYELISEMRKMRKLKPTEEDNFSINSMDTLLAAYNSVMGVVILIGFIITSFSLFVGGIGVMNIMLVSVTERTREIGIRKAVGARRGMILTEFLFESCSLCTIGGVIGLLLSYGIAALINAFVMPAALSLPIVIVGILVSFMVGIVSGLLPAMRASRLDPVVALAYE